MKTWLNLMGTALSFAWFSWNEERQVRKGYYSDACFMQVDMALKHRYRWQNPYTICRRFLVARGASEIHAYGETPLTSLEVIGKKVRLSKKDILLDLGCGRGRGSFFFHCRFGCHVIGIDWVPVFIEKAKKVALEGQSAVDFICGDMTHDAPLTDVTVIYLAWTCMEEEERIRLEQALQTATKGARIITVSYPLASKKFIVQDTFAVRFPWGEGEVFLHERI